MPSKTKNRRAKGNKRRGKRTRNQRGGGWLNTLSLGYAGTADDPTTQTWSEWFGINSGKGWWESLTSSSPTTNPIQAPELPYAPALPASSLSNSVFNPEATTDFNPEATTYNNSMNTNGYGGGKKSKSRSCHRKHRHKHTKSCSK